jgi:hypothetical protein
MEGGWCRQRDGRHRRKVSGEWDEGERERERGREREREREEGRYWLQALTAPFLTSSFDSPELPSPEHMVKGRRGSFNLPAKEEEAGAAQVVTDLRNATGTAAAGAKALAPWCAENASATAKVAMRRDATRHSISILGAKESPLCMMNALQQDRIQIWELTFACLFSTKKVKSLSTKFIMDFIQGRIDYKIQGRIVKMVAVSRSVLL